MTSRIVSRREMLLSGAGAVLGIGVSRLVAARAATPGSFAVPRGATDCHVHVFGDLQRFPMSADRTYTPEPASVQQLLALHESLHIERTVVVTPSVYGTDNRCTVVALRRLGRRAVVPDHFARAPARLGPNQPGFDALVALIRAGKAYMKLSAAYRVSTEGPDYADVAPLARMLVTANPQRILWGSDWPHPDSTPVPGRQATDLWPPYAIDDGRLFNQLAAWVPEADLRKQILVDNPKALYGF
jgi:predicted TIM-barrel fold metal-dependent hydrolase